MLNKKVRLLIIFVALALGIVFSILKIYWVSAVLGFIILYMIF